MNIGKKNRKKKIVVPPLNLSKVINPYFSTIKKDDH
jgi:hypothetical protein